MFFDYGLISKCDLWMKKHYFIAISIKAWPD